MTSTTLFHRDFLLMIVGQIISLFGNAILRFALSLYVLDLTGSAAVFGGILAFSTIPMALFAPVGGVLADRVPHQRIMYALDFFTGGLILLYDGVFFAQGGGAAVAVVMVLLSAIQAVYQPSVLSSIPALAPPHLLQKANGVAIQVQALATLLGPILGGLLYQGVEIRSILVISALCFLFSAVLELFLRIPFTPPEGKRAPLRDLGDAFHFLHREAPYLLRLLWVVAGVNFFLSALFTVGLPYLVKTHLGLDAALYGFAEAALGLGSILGGFCAGALAQAVPLQRSHRYISLTGLLLLPAAAALGTGLPALVCYGVLMAAVLLGMACATLFSVAAQSYLQRQTPSPLLGKVSSFVTAISVCAMPLGQAMYGLLFDALPQAVWAGVLLGAGATVLLARRAGRVLRQFPGEAS